MTDTAFGRQYWFARRPPRSRQWWIVNQDGKKIAQTVAAVGLADDKNALMLAASLDLMRELESITEAYVSERNRWSDEVTDKDGHIARARAALLKARFG